MDLKIPYISLSLFIKRKQHIFRITQILIPVFNIIMQSKAYFQRIISYQSSSFVILGETIDAS
jgi:hypothetical protein